MRLLLIGCEYAGTSTLAHGIYDWGNSHGIGFSIVHDHWKIPRIAGHVPHETSLASLTEDEQEEVMGLSPTLKEIVQRYNLFYHTPSDRLDTDSLLVGHHFDDAIYSQLYFGYGGDDSPGDRRVVSREVERRILAYAPETVLVLVKTSRDIIARRMQESPHVREVLKETDIEYVLARFEDGFNQSMIQNKIIIDTSSATVDQSVGELVENIGSYLTQRDRIRMLTKDF